MLPSTRSCPVVDPPRLLSRMSVLKMVRRRPAARQRQNIPPLSLPLSASNSRRIQTGTKQNIATSLSLSLLVFNSLVSCLLIKSIQFRVKMLWAFVSKLY
uniref:Uncharacterized protein n=1 Tax=Cacopsylla melanoneura TaxID=428564 RepID=A0A8D8WK82_9HEMI